MSQTNRARTSWNDNNRELDVGKTRKRQREKKMEWQKTLTYRQQTTTRWGNEEKATKKCSAARKSWNGKRH